MAKPKRQDYSREMSYHIQSWKDSGKTQKQYCSLNNITYSRFYYWLRKVREKDNSIMNGFIPIRVNGSEPRLMTDIEIKYPNGVCISVASSDIQYNTSQKLRPLLNPTCTQESGIAISAWLSFFRLLSFPVLNATT
jgi:hypothetical protein